MAMSVSLQYYDTGRRKCIVRMDEMQENNYLRKCTVLEHERFTNQLVMWENEVRDARRMDLDDKQYKNMQFRMMGSNHNLQNQYTQLQMRYQSQDNQTLTNKKVADEKAKKHASNLMKCYWAHYNKIKETTV